jgi:hypothetical protein
VPTASADEVAQVIEAVADLLWPVLAFVAVFIFRSELAALSKRLRRLRAGGVEADLDQALDELQASAQKAEEATPRVPAEIPKRVESGTAMEGDETLPVTPSVGAVENEAERILEHASDSPRAALMLLSAELERKSREVLSTRSPDATGAPFFRQLDLLEVSPAARRASKEFREVRNRIVHGGVASDEETLRAIDAGISILEAISRIPHEVNIVLEPKVPCFVDADAQHPHDFEAVLLGAEHPPTGEFQKRAFPHTGRPLPKGEAVTWEWKSGRVFPETWYRDPETEKLEYGWTSSLEFSGQPLHPGPRPRD